MTLGSMSDEEFKSGLYRMKEMYFPSPNMDKVIKMNKKHVGRKLDSNRPLSTIMGNNTSLSLQKRYLKYSPEK